MALEARTDYGLSKVEADDILAQLLWRSHRGEALPRRADWKSQRFGLKCCRGLGPIVKEEALEYRLFIDTTARMAEALAPRPA